MTPPSSPLVQAADDIRDHMITAETKPCVHVEDCHQLEDRSKFIFIDFMACMPLPTLYC